ncbi:flagellar hook-basal body complex protein [Roseateles sp. NT4]|uniref:flagellar hook-basal body complex protein n=1 Tax=Roseateles sp. NT4 TaxID=3453715 RepID=UPI003EEBB231
MNTLDIAAIGLRQDLDRLKLTSQNVANLSTTGYKRQIAVQKPFADFMDVAADLQVQTDSKAGKLNATGQTLDVALPEGRYLLLELDDGSQALSRQGSMQIDAQGLLRTLGGHKVIGSRGPISLRTDQRGELEIDGQGQLKQQGQVLDALRLINAKNLQSLGDGLYAADSSQWENETPVVGVRSGQLEQSNVVPSQEMVNLMTTTRHAETMVKLFQAADDMQATAIRRLGENN